MKFTLNENEIKTAITLYLKANAAVDVHGMEFSAKRDGLIAEVDANVLEMPKVSVEPATVPEIEPEGTEEMEPTYTVEFEPSEPEEEFKADPEELVIKEKPIEITEEQLELHLESDEEDDVPFTLSATPAVTDEEIAAVEAAMVEQEQALETEKLEITTMDQAEIHIDEESSETEEMPVQNTMSIADILGS